MQAAIITSSSMTAYMSRVEVELAHDGHAEQHKEHAALPQQHASCAAEQSPKTAPMLVYVSLLHVNHIIYHLITKEDKKPLVLLHKEGIIYFLKRGRQNQ